MAVRWIGLRNYFRRCGGPVMTCAGTTSFRFLFGAGAARRCGGMSQCLCVPAGPFCCCLLRTPSTWEGGRGTARAAAVGRGSKVQVAVLPAA